MRHTIPGKQKQTKKCQYNSDPDIKRWYFFKENKKQYRHKRDIKRREECRLTTCDRLQAYRLKYIRKGDNDTNEKTGNHFLTAEIFGRLAGERLSILSIFGGILVLLGVLVSELKFKKLWVYFFKR